jgi:hypothetical protein
MERILIVLITIGAITFTACNNNNKSSKENDMSKMNSDTTKMSAADATQITEVTHNFTNVSPQLAASLKVVVDHYLDIKNALIRNSGSEAANDGKAMADAISKVDKSLLTADQKKIYNDIEGDLKENAEHIGKSSGDIAHQREHFSMMSEDVYDLVKTFGGGQSLYHEHCPMAEDGKGAIWLSETKEVKNPYFGGKMNECVKVKEVIR